MTPGKRHYRVLMTASRTTRHARISAVLASTGDRRLGELLSAATPLGSGIGGTTWRLDVDGRPVFVKRVALTDLELRPEHVRSTANVFGLPGHSHYGVGSAGGGAWRELAAHTLANDWVLEGGSTNFPLLHHWRVLPRPKRPVTAAVHAEIERNVAFWHDDPAVRSRLEALAGSGADLVLFLEHLPRTVTAWLRTADTATAATLMERDLREVTAFLGAQGMQHFDAHFDNILTDGERLYLADFGLALSSRFALSGPEERFLDEHASHDTGYVLARLVNWAVTAGGLSWAHPRERNAYVRACAEGREVPDLPPAAAGIVRRHAPVAAVVNDFYFALHGESRKTPYPRAEIERALVRAG